MNVKHILMTAVALCSTVAGFASTNADSMRAAASVQTNTKYSNSLTLTRDADGNIVSFHVNGVGATDASILLMRAASPLSAEFTVVSGVTKEGSVSYFMLPSNVATAYIVEAISQDLVNAGAVSIQINRVITGKM